MKFFGLFAVLLSSVAALSAQPTVGQGGVLNAASFNRDALPGDGLAQGGMFVVFGQGLGPAALAQAPGLPLQTELAGTSVRVTVAGTTVTALLFFTSAGQLAGVLPSNTPIGEGTLTVTFGGLTSAPVSVKVVQNAFGIFTRNQAGFGPVIVQNFISPTDVRLNSLPEAIQPGQAGILWGTGLGPIDGDDAVLPPVVNLPFNVEVILGGRVTVKPFYAGRSPQFPAIDQINFIVPPGIVGCFVSIAIRVNGVVSNYGSIAISSGGKYCDDPFTAEEMMTAERNSELRVGVVSVFTGEGEADLSSAAVSYSLNLLNQSTLSRVQLQPVATPLGTCSVWPEGTEDIFPEDIGNPRELDGGELTITSPAGTIPIDDDEEDPPRGFFVPGLLTVRGAGGADVGAFEASLVLPAPGSLDTPLPVVRLNRAQDLTLRWSGVSPGMGYVAVAGLSTDQVRGVGRTFLCAERADAGSLTVPALVLGSLPPSVAGEGVENAPSQDFEAPGQLFVVAGTLPEKGHYTVPGLDVGLFLPLQLIGFTEPMFE